MSYSDDQVAARISISKKSIPLHDKHFPPCFTDWKVVSKQGNDRTSFQFDLLDMAIFSLIFWWGILKYNFFYCSKLSFKNSCSFHNDFLMHCVVISTLSKIVSFCSEDSLLNNLNLRMIVLAWMWGTNKIWQHSS